MIILNFCNKNRSKFFFKVSSDFYPYDIVIENIWIVLESDIKCQSVNVFKLKKRL